MISVIYKQLAVKCEYPEVLVHPTALQHRLPNRLQWVLTMVSWSPETFQLHTIYNYKYRHYLRSWYALLQSVLSYFNFLKI